MSKLEPRKNQQQQFYANYFWKEKGKLKHFNFSKSAQMGELNAFHTDCKSRVKRIWWSDFYLLLLSLPSNCDKSVGAKFWLRVNTINPFWLRCPENHYETTSNFFAADAAVVCSHIKHIFVSVADLFLLQNCDKLIETGFSASFSKLLYYNEIQ